MGARHASATGVAVDGRIGRLMMDGRLIVHVADLLNRRRIADHPHLSVMGMMQAWRIRGGGVRPRHMHRHVSDFGNVADMHNAGHIRGTGMHPTAIAMAAVATMAGTGLSADRDDEADKQYRTCGQVTPNDHLNLRQG